MTRASLQVRLGAVAGPGRGAEREDPEGEAVPGEGHADWGAVQPAAAAGGSAPTDASRRDGTARARFRSLTNFSFAPCRARTRRCARSA